MREYHLNEAILDLPPQLKDKTVQMFTVSDDGINEFNLVISRVQVPEHDTLERFAERTVDELQERPGFELKHMTTRLVSGADAIEVAYKWRKDDIHLYQRQVATLVQSPAPGYRQVLLFTATCLRAADDLWNKAFDRILDSVQTRHPLSTEAISSMQDVAVEAPIRASQTHAPAAHVFALSPRKQLLQVFREAEEACAAISALEVEDGLWLFYASDGTRLEAVFTAPNRGRIWRSAGVYRLRMAGNSRTPTLLAGLDQAARIKGRPPFETLEAVRAHLERKTLVEASAA